MAERTPPVFLQAGSYAADLVRNALAQSILTGGVINVGDLIVTAPGGTQSVSVGAGQAWVMGSRALQGSYHVINDAAKVVTVAASDPTNPRYDRVVAQIQDAAYAGAVNAFAISVITGVAAASPAEPAIPADCVELARVLVPAASTSVTAGNILDRRVRAVRRGAVYSAPTIADPGLVALAIASQTGNAFEVRDATNTVRTAANAAGVMSGGLAPSRRALTVSPGTSLGASSNAGIVVTGSTFQALVTGRYFWETTSAYRSTTAGPLSVLTEVILGGTAGSSETGFVTVQGTSSIVASGYFDLTAGTTSTIGYRYSTGAGTGVYTLDTVFLKLYLGTILT